MAYKLLWVNEAVEGERDLATRATRLFDASFAPHVTHVGSPIRRLA